MTVKIVNDNEMLFLDDIIILEDEISKPFNIPDLPIFSSDELTIFYKDQIYAAENNPPKLGNYLKIHTQKFELKRQAPPKIQESEWFSNNESTISQLQKEFIVRCVDGITINGSSDNVLGHQISSELIERIEQYYAGTDKEKKTEIQAINNSNTLFNTLQASEQSLILDGKIYNLMTIGEYLSGFKKAFEPGLYKQMIKICKTKTPKEVAGTLDANHDKLSTRALFYLRDKIWNGESSFEINIDGTYMVPQYTGDVKGVMDEYTGKLREKIKFMAAKKYK